jgi:prepilin-type N-terminal cleavage/methylation domain-containing protein
MKNKAFTLIELLVVIAIVGLLSTIVLVVTSGVSEQGRIAKGLQFDKHLQNALGSDAVGIWNFDEGENSIAYDASGWGNNGTLLNSPVWQCASINPNFTPSNQGCSLEFDGNDDRITISDSPSLKWGDGSLTISHWLYLDSYPVGDTYGRATFIKRDGVAWFNSRININGTIQMETKSYTPSELYKSVNTNEPVGLSAWHHLVLVIDRRTNKMYWIKNGAIASSQTDIAGLGSLSNSTALLLGYGINGTIDGRIDDVRIYTVPLTLAQIKQLYYVGLQNILVKGQISQREYQQRLTE